MTDPSPELREILQQAVALEASDIHIKPDAPPAVRVAGRIRRLSETPLARSETEAMIRSVLNEVQATRFLKEWELDFSLDIPGLARYRANCHYDRGGWSLALRALRTRIPRIEELGLPPIVAELAVMPRGLILVTGPTGSGKTTSLAAMIRIINEHHAATIVTIEDPIEYLQSDVQAFIRQREIGLDTRSFPEALKRVLRQDPEVIIIGEMRDLETISTALTAAETGHLVIATLHTNSAEATINRIIDVYPPNQQHQIRIQLAATLQAVISQQLIPRADGTGVVLAFELLLGTYAVRRLIREEKTYSISTYIQSGKAHGMITMDFSLAHLYREGYISFEEATAHALDPEEFRKLV